MEPRPMGIDPNNNYNNNNIYYQQQEYNGIGSNQNNYSSQMMGDPYSNQPLFINK